MTYTFIEALARSRIFSSEGLKIESIVTYIKKNTSKYSKEATKHIPKYASTGGYSQEPNTLRNGDNFWLSNKHIVSDSFNFLSAPPSGFYGTNKSLQIYEVVDQFGHPARPISKKLEYDEIVLIEKVEGKWALIKNNESGLIGYVLFEDLEKRKF